MPSVLSLAAIKLIERQIDMLFDKAKGRYLGPAAIDKRIYLGDFSSPKSLPGIFMAAAREEGAVPDKDIIAHLTRNAANYLDAYRASTKAQVVKEVQAFLQEAATKGVETDVQTVLGGKLADTWGKVTGDVKRLIDTEASNARNMGALEGIIGVNTSQGIEDPVVYFVVVRDEHLCDECKRLHLLEDEVTPKLWYLSELKHGYHKRKEPFPALGGEHPHCRCTLVTLMPGYGFGDDGMVKYISPDHDEMEEQRGLSKSEDLEKIVLDPNAGYTLKHSMGEMENPYQDEQEPIVWGVRVTAHAPDGSQVGSALLLQHPHHADELEPYGIEVHEAHRRRGIGSAMYAHAEKITGKKVVQSGYQTSDGNALWAGNAKLKQFGKTEPLAKSDWPTSKYLAELARFGWVPTDRSAKHPTLTNKHFTPTRPLTLKHSEMRRIGIENMENCAKDAGLVWDYDGLRANPKHPYAEHYRRVGLLEPDPAAPPPMKTWTPMGPHKVVPIDQLVSTKPHLEAWQHLKFKKLLAEGQHQAVPPISTMELEGQHHVLEGDEQLQAAKDLGYTHVPVRSS